MMPAIKKAFKLMGDDIVQLSVFNITNENNSFSIIIPRHYQTEFAEKMINDLNILLELKSLELHVNEVRKRGSKIKIGD